MSIAHTSTFRASGAVVLAVCLTPACTRPNPAFGEFDDESGSDTVTPFDIPMSCPDRVDPGFEIEVLVRAEEDGPPIEGCGDKIFEITGFVSNDDGNGTWSVAPCVSPNCFPGCEMGDPVFIEFDVPPPLQPTAPDPTTCTEIRVHHHDPVVGESICDFKAASVTIEEDPAFMAVAGSLEGVDSLASLDAVPNLADGLDCACGDPERLDPGLYSLGFPGAQPPVQLTQFDPPAMAMFGDQNLVFAVTQSASDEECAGRPRFDWVVLRP